MILEMIFKKEINFIYSKYLIINSSRDADGIMLQF